MEYMPEVSKTRSIFKFKHSKMSNRVVFVIVMWNDDANNCDHKCMCNINLA